MQCAHGYDQQAVFSNQTQSCSTSSSLNTVLCFLMISHCFGTSAQFFQSNTFPTLSLGSSQGVRIQISTFVQSEVPDNISVVSILNSENQLVTDLQLQKKLFAPHCGVYMSFVRPINPALDIGRSPPPHGSPICHFLWGHPAPRPIFPLTFLGELNH